MDGITCLAIVFGTFWSISIITCFDDQIVPVGIPSSWVLCSFGLSLSSVTTSLLSDTRYCRLIQSFSGTSQFSKEPCFLLVGMGFRNQDLGTRLLLKCCCSQALSVNRVREMHVCVQTTFTTLFLCLFILVY